MLAADTDPAQADPRDTNFLAKVGARVHAARARARLSRRALSELSNVSQRYLANLEGGSGNISIALLKRIADALDCPVEALVGDDRIVPLLGAATQEQRAAILRILDPSPQKAGRVALIGLRGAGKSTLGKLSAASLGVKFVELNQEIQAISGMPVTELMALYGQEGYRRLERQAIENIANANQTLVLAAAGGIVSEPETFSYLLSRYHTIWLKAQPEEHMARVRAQGDTRPMAGIPAAMEELKTILTSREALYARADALVDTSGQTLQTSLADLLAVIAEHGFIRR
jgi:XRE family aerobic/anaerobic benzoate catabolism transcriptional regulator